MIVVYDLETLRNFFLYVDLQIESDEFTIFEISKFKNDLIKYVDYLSGVKRQVGFNNLAFDSQIQQYIVENHKRWSKFDGEKIANIIHDYVQYVIDKSNRKEWPDYNEKNLIIKQADLYKIWHFDNEAKRTSLKWLQYMMDWHNIEDMPIDHLTSIQERSVADSIISYCKNDCLSTREFYNITLGKTENKLYKGIDRLQLRKDVKEEFKFNCTNFNDVRIGDEINKINYLEATGLSRYDLKDIRVTVNRFTFEDCFPSYIKFTSPELRAFIESIRYTPVNIDGKQEFPFKFGSTRYTFAKGGLHSNDNPRLVIPKNNEILRDADVGSMYPNAIRKRRLFPRHLGEKWLNGYEHVIQLRLNAKDKFKETGDPKYQSIQEAFKLALNGGSFGKTQEKFNWQFDPFVTFCVTIGCEIDLLMLIEKLETYGIKVISANTDGVVCLFDKELEPQYKKACSEWQQSVGNNDLGILEYTDYSLFAQRSVNDYIAIKTDEKVKHKGSSFTIYHELHKNKSYRIISLALDAFYTKGLNPRAFITNHENIFDFCAGMRTKGEWYLEAHGVSEGKIFKQRLQKTNRYYVSNKGVKLIKSNPDGRAIKEDAGKWLSTIYNKHVQKDIKDYDINYDFYVKKTYEIISEIQPEISGEDYKQLSMF